MEEHTLTIEECQKICDEQVKPMKIGNTDQFTLGFNQAVENIRRKLTQEWMSKYENKH